MNYFAIQLFGVVVGIPLVIMLTWYVMDKQAKTRERAAFAARHGASLSPHIAPHMIRNLEIFDLSVDAGRIKDVLTGLRGDITYVIFDLLQNRRELAAWTILLLRSWVPDTIWTTIIYCESDRHLSMNFSLQPKGWLERITLGRGVHPEIFTSPGIPAKHVLRVSDQDKASRIFTREVLRHLIDNRIMSLEGRDNKALVQLKTRVKGKRLDDFIDRVLHSYDAVWSKG